MIDQKQQRKGYGRAALRQVIAQICEEVDPEAIYISFEPENTAAQALYEQEGFVDTGEYFEREKIYRLDLKN
jgi:diamine N-acetyltransferase